MMDLPLHIFYRLVAVSGENGLMRKRPLGEISLWDIIKSSSVFAFAQPGCGKIWICVFYLREANTTCGVTQLSKQFALGANSSNRKKSLVARRHLAMRTCSSSRRRRIYIIGHRHIVCLCLLLHNIIVFPIQYFF